jgi:hypothetical protein
MGIFHKGGRWGFAWICEGGHRTKRMVDPEQPESGGTSTLRCCRCTRSVDVPMKLLAE